MNREQFAGIRLELAGKIKEVWGGWIGDPQRAAAGRRDQATGIATQDDANARVEAARQLKQFRHQHRNWFF